MVKSSLEAEAWMEVNSFDDEGQVNVSLLEHPICRWQAPSLSFVKCNVGSSWVEETKISGAAWITRNHYSTPLSHSRRAYLHTESKLRGRVVMLFRIKYLLGWRDNTVSGYCWCVH